MALTGHVLCRIYGQVQGVPPFENASGVAAFTNVKSYPVAPNTYVPTANLTIWPLANGVQMGPNNFYVYSVLQLPPTANQIYPIQLATDQTASTLAAAAT